MTMIKIEVIFIWNTLVLSKYCVAVFEYIQQSVTVDVARAACQQKNMHLAVINSQEKFDEVYNLLTNNGRYFPTAGVYIGLQYDTVKKYHVWEDGTQAVWTNWYVNEPYNVETRHCVRLGRDADLKFRTTDCTYKHFYVCSSENSALQSSGSSSSSKESSKKDMIVGLSVGFGAFAGVIGACCIVCCCCCSSRDEPAAKKPLVHNSKPKPRAIVGKRGRSPPAVYYSRRSSGRNSNNTSYTGSSHMDDFEQDDDIKSVVIGPYEQRMTFNNNSKPDSPCSIESTSPRDKSGDFMHYI